MSKNEAALPSLAPGFFFAFRGSLTSIKRDAVETKLPLLNGQNTNSLIIAGFWMSSPLLMFIWDGMQMGYR